MSGSGAAWAGVATFAVISVIGVGAALLCVNQKGGSKRSRLPQPGTVDPQLAAFARDRWRRASDARLSRRLSGAVSGYVFKNADGDIRLAGFMSR